MATDARTTSEDFEPMGADMSEEARRRRQASGPLIVTLPPDFESNPGLPPEVWEHRPDGVDAPPQ